MGKPEAIVARDENAIVAEVKSWPERTKNFYTEVRTEMKKVTSPSMKEVQATTMVVIFAVFMFAGYFFIVDKVLSEGVKHLFAYFGSH